MADSTYTQLVSEFTHHNARYQEAVREYTPVFEPGDPRIPLMEECLMAYEAFKELGYDDEEAFTRACDGDKSGTGCWVYGACFEHYLMWVGRPRSLPKAKRAMHGSLGKENS